jgi:hypothetical protein
MWLLKKQRVNKSPAVLLLTEEVLAREEAIKSSFQAEQKRALHRHLMYQKSNTLMEIMMMIRTTTEIAELVS